MAPLESLKNPDIKNQGTHNVQHSSTFFIKHLNIEEVEELLETISPLYPDENVQIINYFLNSF
jgi:hypothetical protein